ncbi:MAG: AbrB/MazE/SpoVT family DNA-binding domain-containing protein [Spirochaetales bacterium]|nr:AbrB/MazE/SpoVT family DNA-binding domain-containing protein [Spirochaetales bacterium]
MLISVVPIGNSRGIRIPKSILQQLDIEEKVELEIHNKEIVIRPFKSKPRDGWSKEFMKMHREGEDSSLIENLDDQNDFQWEW